MIPYEIDPSLHATEPDAARLDDGFSPPPAGDAVPAIDAPAEAVLSEKSDF